MATVFIHSMLTKLPNNGENHSFSLMVEDGDWNRSKDMRILGGSADTPGELAMLITDVGPIVMQCPACESTHNLAELLAGDPLKMRFILTGRYSVPPLGSTDRTAQLDLRLMRMPKINLKELLGNIIEGLVRNDLALLRTAMLTGIFIPTEPDDRDN